MRSRSLLSGLKNVSPTGLRSWLPVRRSDAHKSDCGRIYIIAGSRGMTGAAALAALGALRAGAGLVKVASPTSQWPTVARRVPLEAMTEGLPDKNGQVSAAAARTVLTSIESFGADVVAAGPGLGRGPGAKTVVSRLLHGARTNLVLDADALTLLSQMKASPRKAGGLVLTPHEGELGRLLRRPTKAIHARREAAAVEAAKRFHAVCLLKGKGTIVTDGRRLWKNKTGNAAMASGGMGDLLTGLIAGLWGQMDEAPAEGAFHAACLGALLHGRAGDLAFKQSNGLSVLATDVAGFVPAAIGSFRGRAL